MMRKILNLILKTQWVFLLSVGSLRYLLSYVCRRYVLKQKIPAVAILAITYRCPLGCVHCSAAHVSEKELSTEEWKKIILEFAKWGIPRIHFTGGETTLRKDLPELVAYARGFGIVVFVETSGWHVSEELIINLKKSGVTTINVSIDNAEREKHDLLRKVNGSYDYALRTMQYCKKHHIYHMVSTYATPKNIQSKEVLEVIRFAKKIGVPAIRVLPGMPSGRWTNNDEIKVTKEDVRLLRSQYPIYRILDVMLDIPDNQGQQLCKINIQHNLYLAPDGAVHTCPHLPVKFGNVKNDDVRSLVKKMADHEMFKSKSPCYVYDKGFQKKWVYNSSKSEETIPKTEVRPYL